MIRAINEGTGAGYPKDAAAVLLTSWTDSRRGGGAGERARGSAGNAAPGGRVAADDAERALLWKGRKEAAGAVGRLAPTYLLQDAVVRAPGCRRSCASSPPSRPSPRQIANVFHAGDGTSTAHPLRRPGSRGARAREGSERGAPARLHRDGWNGDREHGSAWTSEEPPVPVTRRDLNFMYRLRRVFDRRNHEPGQAPALTPACGEGFRPARPRVPDGAWI